MSGPFVSSSVEHPRALEVSLEVWVEAGVHVRAIHSVPSSVEIILDSGADCSMLPREYAGVGHQAPSGLSGRYVDAQGHKLEVADMRVAEVCVGDLVFKDQFVISDVTSPLLCLGKLSRAGWS